MRTKLYISRLFLVVFLIPTLFSSCEEHGYYVSDDAPMLRFSVDTLSFDTVFTTVGTVTKQVKVYNPYNEPVLISSVSLGGGRQSRFRINVDGDTSLVAKNVAIGAHDSIFIFVQANINPNASTEPFLIEDSICFDFEKHQSRIILNAFGRNAVYHYPEQGRYYSIIDCDNWDHSRPHVIYGYAVVDSATTLWLGAGDEIYMADQASIWVYREGSIVVEGTPSRPVLFTSVRRDGHYRSLPGQWNFIWLSPGSTNNRMDWAVVENGYVGLLVDSVVDNRPTLHITNTIVRNMSHAGILANGSYIKGDNLLVANCKTAAVALQRGGNYSMNNSTFVNYWRYDVRKSPCVVLNNYKTDPYNTNLIYPVDLERAAFNNCIVYGNYAETEIALVATEQARFNVSFNHCLVKAQDSVLNGYGVGLSDMIFNEDPLFVSSSEGDYHLQYDSPARLAGDQNCLLDIRDLDGNVRRLPPTIGAYEIK